MIGITSNKQAQKKLRLLIAALTICLLLSPVSLSPASAESLGIGVSITPEQSGDLSMGDRAWFAIEPGASATREIRVSSQSDIDQLVNFEVFDLEIVNGESVPNTTELSKTANWVSFEPSVLVLPARGTASFSMTYEIPTETPEQAYNAVLRVLATKAGEVETEADGLAVIGAATGVDLEIWLGVGDALSLLPNFNITSISPLILPDGRVLRVGFENLGVIPLALRGSVQFSDPAFSDRAYEPISFVSRVIPSGETGFVDVPVADEITDGLWKVFVSASQQQVKQTRLFEQELTFAAPSSFSVAGLIQILLICLFAVVAVFGIRLMLGRGKTATTSSREPKPPKRPRKLKTNQAAPPQQLSAVEASLQRVRQRLDATGTMPSDQPLSRPVVSEPTKDKDTPAPAVDEQMLAIAIKKALVDILASGEVAGLGSKPTVKSSAQKQSTKSTSKPKVSSSKPKTETKKPPA